MIRPKSTHGPTASRPVLGGDGRVLLTKRVVDHAVPPTTGQFFLRDAALPGFALRVTRGRKTYVLEKRIRGRRRRLTIGHHGPLTVDQARAKAEQLIGRIADGEDPAQDRLDGHAAPTFGELIDMYFERHGPRKKTVKADKNRLERHVADWKTWRLSALSRAEMARRHDRIGRTTPYEANRLLALLSRMFGLAKVWGLFDGDHPTRGIEKFDETKRDRFIQPDELPRLFKALNAESDPYIRGALLTSLLTGCRIGEALAMRWADVHLDQALWRLPETKAGRPHLLPLPGPLVKTLRALPRIQDSPFVFPGRGKARHLTDLTRAWDRIRDKAKLPDVRIHDLRRTLGSWLAIAGASLPLIGKVLNHSQPATTAIYARLNLEPVREALEANATMMLALTKQETAKR